MSWHTQISVAVDNCFASIWCLLLKWLSCIFPFFFSLFFLYASSSAHSCFPSLLFFSLLLLLSVFLYFLLFSATFLSFPLFDLSDSKFRVGPGQRRNQEDAERRAARRERESRPRQIQNAAPDPTGQHEAAHRWVWVHVRTVCSLTSPSGGCLIFTDNRCCRPCKSH